MPNTSIKQCELHCESCDVAFCVHCFSSGNHQNHRIVDAKSFFESKKVDIQKDLHEFETIISIKYQDIVDDFMGQNDIFRKFDERPCQIRRNLEQGY